ncbi:hypothetical protein [Azospirillum sp. ST 5-10]|uniref:hypothetical protein n=1 Tax=unclassified Azospirillum TaxID=2630922 RepID=UPI003F49B6E2
MDETKLTAAWPGLEMTVVRRDLPEEGAEAIAVTVKATPSFDAALGALALPAALALMPLQLWTGLARQAWAPWLGMMSAVPRLERK